MLRDSILNVFVGLHTMESGGERHNLIVISSDFASTESGGVTIKVLRFEHVGTIWNSGNPFKELKENARMQNEEQLRGAIVLEECRMVPNAGSLQTCSDDITVRMIREILPLVRSISEEGVSAPHASTDISASSMHSALYTLFLIY